MNMEKEYNTKDLIKKFLSIEVGIILDNYTNENVVFGRIKPSDKVPITRYFDDLGFRNINILLYDLLLNGHNITKGYVIDRNFDERCFELYRDKIEYIFDNFPIDKSFEEESDDILHYKFGLYEYLKNLYPLFKEIINTQVEPDLFTAVPDILDKEEQRAYYMKAANFVKAIKLKGLKRGGCVDRYVKDLPFISPFIMRLLIKRNGRFLLKNSDTDSLDYKLALLSCLHFYNEYNAKLFELKMLRWEELKNAIS